LNGGGDTARNDLLIEHRGAMKIIPSMKPLNIDTPTSID
jgi:hypothetical protein